jgi:hypothetical protein
VATASAAVHHFFEYGRWPAAAESWAAFRRFLLPGCAAVLVAGGAAALLALDLAALRAGAVPGGPVLVAVTAALAVAGAGYAGLVVVEVGRGAGWRAAARGALAAGARPAVLAASAGVVCLAAALAAMVHPVLAPVLAGHALYALHAVHRRLVPPGRTA